MEDYVSNSMKSKETSAEKRVETQIQGTASTKKKGALTKLSEAFVPEDVTSVKDYIVKETTDILVTAVKKCISSTVNRILYGDSNAPTTNNKPSSSLAPSYRAYYDQKENSTPYRPRVGSVYTFDEVEFRTLKDVNDAIVELKNVQERYGVVRIADMYEVAHLENLIRWTDNNYGWTDVRSAHWDHYINQDGEDRYILKMPRPLPL